MTGVMVIGACGYAATGSGAVYDFLREFDEIQIPKNESEFKYTYKIDGLEDLQFHLMEKYSKTSTGDAAIKRFLKASKYAYVPFVKKPVPTKEYIELTKHYVNELVQGSFLGMENIDYENCSWFRSVAVLGFKKVIIPFYEKLFRHSYNFWPIRKLYICIEPDNFWSASKEYMAGMLKAMGFDLSKPILLNQPFEGNQPENSFPFFDDPKAIIIDRDPRDVYIAHQKIYFGEGRHMPRGDVRLFVEQYRQVRMHQKRENTSNKLFIQFEAFVYDYETISKEIIEFLGLKEHSHPKMYFKPERSINNTQLYLRYPDLKDDIDYIEKNLKEYLFDFSRYGEIIHTNKSF